MNRPLLLLWIACFSLSPTIAQLFEPEDGQCFVFIGQDLGATGGLDGYSEGYTDYFETPAGVTVYSNLSPGGESFGFYFSGLDGLERKANWGAGYCHANAYLEDSTYQNSMIAIGLSLVDHDKQVTKGIHDDLIRELGVWIQEADRPVFLRIGYEFDGWEWNHYNQKFYLASWKRIHDIFEEMNVENVAFVWQSKGTGSDQEVLEAWYPGDEYVDWCGYSYFGSPDTEMITFARRHQKPVFIAEATPVREMDGLFLDTDLKKEGLDKLIWETWFEPFFQTIEENQDVIKAISYINADWSSQPMWILNPVFQNVDARIQVSEYVTDRWVAELKNPNYLHAADLDPDLTRE